VLGLGYEEVRITMVNRWTIGLQRGKVIHENKCGSVRRIANSSSACITGTEITAWVKSLRGRARCFLDLTLPWAFRALRRDQHPFFSERIESPVWSVLQFVGDHRSSRYPSGCALHQRHAL